jgi:hypothetical protein
MPKFFPQNWRAIAAQKEESVKVVGIIICIVAVARFIWSVSNISNLPGA